MTGIFAVALTLQRFNHQRRLILSIMAENRGFFLIVPLSDASAEPSQWCKFFGSGHCIKLPYAVTLSNSVYQMRSWGSTSTSALKLS